MVKICLPMSRGGRPSLGSVPAYFLSELRCNTFLSSRAFLNTFARHRAAKELGWVLRQPCLHEGRPVGREEVKVAMAAWACTWLGTASP